MGFFDRLFKTKPAAPPPPPDLPLPPALPASARIESYEVVDAIGILRLASGDAVRFGRSACKGFEPVVGASVIITELTPHAGGFRARGVTLDPSERDYDRLLGARDREAGLPARTQSAAEAVACAKQLGIVTVLLPEPLPEGTLPLREWAARLGLTGAGIEIHTERDLEFSIGRLTVLTYPGRTPFPTDDLELDAVAGFDGGRSFIGLGVGVPGVERANRLLGLTRDCWAADGRMRQLSRLVRALAEQGSAVVLHRAGERVVPAATFIRKLQDLDDPECRPFAAWLGLGVANCDSELLYDTLGMDVFGLPDVCVPLYAEDDASLDRAHEAVLFACHRMVRENRELNVGEILRVPVSARIGAWPLEVAESDPVLHYSVEAVEEVIRLRPVEA